MYTIAEQYDVQSLKNLAKTKYAEVLPTEWNSPSFVASLELMYELTPESDRLLKDVALKIAGKHCKEFADRGEFAQLCKDNGEIALDVMKASLAMSRVLSIHCPSCRQFGTVSEQGGINQCSSCCFTLNA